MRLVGVFLSPYVRRVAVSLNMLKLPFELEDVFVFGDPETVRRYNPLTRIPILVLDDGTNLVESGAILDEIDQMVPADQRLIPAEGLPRRHVLQATSIALGCAEKAQWAFYEGRVRPEDKIHTPWISHNDRQVIGGFEHLNAQAAEIADDGWIAGTSGISQGDITTTTAFTFAKLARPDLELAKRFPQLSRLAARCEEMPEFALAPLPSPERLQNMLSRPFVS